MDELDLGATIKGFTPGQKVFARYTLKKILGRGGMGVVWLARDEELERDVALKFLPEVVAMDKQSLNELKRETRRSLELTHPHIVRIYDFVQDGRTAAISMEYVAGETLAGLKADRPGHCFEAADLQKWAQQLCEALAHAHDKAQVVHRDLKPANLMVDARGDLKVADFGIAASVSDSVSRVSAQSGSSGTPVYMSPQQMMGERPAVTDDIYSVGATLYDLLTGKPPFHSGNIIAQVQGKVPPPVAQRRAELGVAGAAIPPGWEQTIAACLAKEAAARPRTAAELLQGLRGMGGGEGSAGAAIERPAPDRGRAPSPKVEAEPAAATTPRRSNFALVAVLTAITLAVAAGGGWWLRTQAQARERLVEEQRLAAEQQRQAELAAEQSRQAEIARLAALRIPVTLRTNPAGAEIFVAGQSRGLAPVAGLPLPLGEHKIVARLRDHDDLEYTLTVAEHGQTEWTLPLARSTGLVTLRARPSGAGYAVYPVNADGASSRMARASGTVPAEGLALETGKYEVVVTPVPAVPGLEHREVVTVRKGETASVDADVRAAGLRVTSTPAGATVLIDGREAGKTPFLLERQLPGSRRQVELRLDGYEPEARGFELARGDEPETWEATLREQPKVMLRPSFADGPRVFDVNIRINSTTSGQTVAGGQTTPIPASRNNSVVDARYTVMAYDSSGLIRRVAATTQTNDLFRPGTVIEFDWNGGVWVGAFKSGGFTNANSSLEFLAPSYPGTWVDRRILPEGLATAGRTWEVPASAATVLLPSLRFQTATGTIRGRVVAVDPARVPAWADVEYAFDLRGPLIIAEVSRKLLAAGQAMTMQGGYAGAITLRFDLAGNYVSRAHVKHKGGLETKVDAGGQTLAQTTMSIDTDVEFTVVPTEGAAKTSGARPDSDFTGASASGVPKVPVVFYRRNNLLIGTGERFGIELDGRRLAVLRDGEFARLELPAGENAIEITQLVLGKVLHRNRVRIRADGGHENYQEVSHAANGTARVDERTEAEAAPMIARLKPARDVAPDAPKS